MKALLLEDNLSLAQCLQEFLFNQGLEVDIGSSYKEASDFIDKNSYDLIVLDILLIDKKGFEVLEILSQRNTKPHLKIILISGLFDKSSVLKNIPERFKNHCTFMQKPINEKDFLHCIEEIKKREVENEKLSIFESFFEKNLMEKPLDFFLLKNRTFNSKELILAISLAHCKNFTGEFQITTDNEASVTIKFFKGDIIKLISNSKKSFFGTLLVEHGLSLPKDIENLLEEKEPNKPIGERLIEKKLLSPYMLNFILKEQVKIRLSEVMSHSSFCLNIVEESCENSEPANIDFNEIDFIEWLADSLQTELTEDFFKNFYVEVKFHLIQKSNQINKALIYQKQFLMDYNALFKGIVENNTVESVVENSKNKHRSLQLLFFGFLTKSLSLKSKKKETIDLQKVEFLLDSIIEKDSEDLFSILNLPWNASSQEVSKGYKQLVQNIHSDLLPESASVKLKEKSKKAFHKVIKSYQILTDEEKRKEYMKGQKEDHFIQLMNQYEEGLTKIKKEEYQKGLEVLSKIINYQQTPSNTILYILWAKLKTLESDPSKSREKLVKIKKDIDSCSISLRTSPLFWYVKALFCVEIEKYEQAEELFKKSLQIQKNFLEARKELILLKEKIRKSKLKDKKSFFDFLVKKTG